MMPTPQAQFADAESFGSVGALDCLGAADLLRGLGVAHARGVAIVGARAADRYGLRWARELGEQLGRAGEVVVSGGALGIDGAAHEGALDAGAPTVAVLGTGVDVPYPERHAPLFARIVQSGGAVVSPFPRGTLPRAFHFPKRNAVIASLSRAVVVVEASARSGSISTANVAKRMGIPLFAHPGTPGCNALLVAGAQPALDISALVATLCDRPMLTLPSLDPQLERMLTALARPCSSEELCASLDIDLTDVLEQLLELESLRRIVRLPDGRNLAIAAGTKE